MVRLKVISLFIALSFLSFWAQAVPLCQNLFTTQMSIDSFSVSTIASLEAKNPVGTFKYKDFVIAGDLASLQIQPTISSLLQVASTATTRYHGTLSLNSAYGPGSLDLVRLTLKDSNLAYNHHDLVALLRSHESLANRVGFYKVSGYDNLVWAPSVTLLNARLKQIAQENGLEKPIWTFEKVDGVVDLEPYLNMLSEGKFPFAAGEYNLSVHDAMHGVAFAALNSTKKSSKIMEMSLKRVQLANQLYKDIKTHFPQFKKRVEKYIGMIASDPLEKTMLLSIILSGNYNYYSAAENLKNGQAFELQNREISIQRVKSLLKVLAHGHINFKFIYDKLNKSQLTTAEQNKLKEIFNDKVSQAAFANDALLTQAATEIVDRFMNADHISTSEQIKQKQLQKGTYVDVVDPSNPVDAMVSEKEEPL